MLPLRASEESGFIRTAEGRSRKLAVIALSHLLVIPFIDFVHEHDQCCHSVLPVIGSACDHEKSRTEYHFLSDSKLSRYVYNAIRHYTHTQLFNGPLSGTTRVSWLQKGKTSLDFIEAGNSESQWHQLGHMQVCTLPQTDNHARTPPPMRYGIDITIFDTMHCITSTLYLMAGN